MTEMQSGDLCRIRDDDLPEYGVSHYRCNEFADGTVTDARTGKIVTPAKPGAPRGFRRPGVGAPAK